MQERYDVIVVGGGPSGVCAAVGVTAAWAAREGFLPREVDGVKLKTAILGG
jgi:thioredoxin reductase